MCVYFAHIGKMTWVRLLSTDLIVIASANYNHFTMLCTCYLFPFCNVFNSRKPFVNLHNDYEHSLCISFGLVRLWRLAMRTTITRNMESKRICALTHINSTTHLSLNVICITQELFLFSIIAHLHKHNNNNAYAVLSSGWSSIWTPRMCVCLCVQ